MPKNAVQAFLSSGECRYIFNEEPDWIGQGSPDRAKTNLALYWDNNFLSDGLGRQIAKSLSDEQAAALTGANNKLFDLLKQWDASAPSESLALDIFMAMTELRYISRNAAGAEKATSKLSGVFGDLLCSVFVGVEAKNRALDEAEVRSALTLALACQNITGGSIPEEFEEIPAALYWETLMDLVPADAKHCADELWEALHRFEQTEDVAGLKSSERAKLYDRVLDAARKLQTTCRDLAPSGYAKSRFDPIVAAAFEAAAGVIPRVEDAWTPPSAPPGLIRYDGTSSLPTIGTRGRYDPNAPNAAELARVEQELAEERRRTHDELLRTLAEELAREQGK